MIRALVLIAAAASAGRAAALFQDSFSVPGTHPDLARWTTETGPSSFLGRTQLADWVTPGAVGQFVIANDGAHLALNTYDPTGSLANPSFYGTHAKTLLPFQPTRNSDVVFTARLQLTSLQPGVVYGIYLYGCDPALCASRHDEIDIELVTNRLQPGAPPLAVELNRYADEPVDAGNGLFAPLPAGFDPLAPHDWTIRWSLAKIEYSVDGVRLAAAASHLPKGPMHVNVNAWAAGPEWMDAFNTSFQPAKSAAQNQTFFALLTSVTVTSPRTPPSRGAR